MICEGCGERVDRCRCDGSPLAEDMAFGFHLTDETQEHDIYEEDDPWPMPGM